MEDGTETGAEAGINEISSLLSRIEVEQRRLTNCNKVSYLVNTAASSTVSIYNILDLVTKTNMLNIPKDAKFVPPAVIAMILTIAKSFYLAAIAKAEIQEAPPEPDLLKIETRINAGFNSIEWINGVTGSFIISYVFAIKILGYFFPGTHEHPSQKLLISFYGGGLGGPILLSVFCGLLNIKKVYNTLNQLMDKCLSPVSKQAGVTVGHTVMNFLGAHATMGVLIDFLNIVKFCLNQEKQDAVDDYLKEHYFIIAGIFMGIAATISLGITARAIYEKYHRLDNKLSAKYESFLNGSVIGGFAITVVKFLVQGFAKEKDYVIGGLYLALVLLLPSLFGLLRLKAYQDLAYNTMTVGTSLSGSRYNFHNSEAASHVTERRTPSVTSSRPFNYSSITPALGETSNVSTTSGQGIGEEGGGLRRRPTPNTSSQSIQQDEERVSRQGSIQTVRDTEQQEGQTNTNITSSFS